MKLISKAVWYIESHFADEISLEVIAAACNVSRFHMARAFGLATGCPVMRYVRGRRLTEAARVLAQGAPDILGVALDAGYGSHEAFTRAFRDQFGITPEALRARGGLRGLELVEPIKWETTTMTKAEYDLEEPRREASRGLMIAGLKARYTAATIGGIPMQWQRFRTIVDSISRRWADGVSFGVCCGFDEAGEFDYVTGVEVSTLAGLPPDVTGVQIPATKYLVFSHRGHVSGIPATWEAIMDRWLPSSGIRMANAPCFERMARDFEPSSGVGVVEIWIPVEA